MKNELYKNINDKVSELFDALPDYYANFDKSRDRKGRCFCVWSFDTKKDRDFFRKFMDSTNLVYFSGGELCQKLKTL